MIFRRSTPQQAGIEVCQAFHWSIDTLGHQAQIHWIIHFYHVVSIRRIKLNAVEAMEFVMDKINGTKTNQDFITSMSQ